MCYSCIFPVYGLIGFFSRRSPPKTPFHPGSPRATLWCTFSFEQIHIPQPCVQLTVTASLVNQHELYNASELTRGELWF
jgi:hypothetical protein